MVKGERGTLDMLTLDRVHLTHDMGQPQLLTLLHYGKAEKAAWKTEKDMEAWALPSRCL